MATYLRAAHAPSQQSARERREAVDALMGDMDLLDASTASIESWAAGGDASVAPALAMGGAPKTKAAAAGKTGGFGGGGGGAKKSKKKKR